jgi:cytoskeleton protein RodZ
LDLRTFFRVIRRFWPLVAVGAVLAVALSFISFFRVDITGKPHVTYRQHETWKGTEVLLLTQRGFPWGRTIYPYRISKKTGLQIPAAPFADPGRFTSLAVFYAQLANSDAVRALVAKAGRLGGTYSASPVVKSVGGGPGTQPITQLVPLIQIDGFARTPPQALGIARRVSQALRSYLERRQTGAGIPAKQRIVVQVLSTARKATLARGRRLTIPLIAFLGTLIATLGLAFVLENLRPRTHADPERADSEPAGEPPSDSAVTPWTGGRGNDESRPGARAEAGSRALPGLSYLAASPSPRIDGQVQAPASSSSDLTTAMGGRLREARLRRGLDLPMVEARIDVQTKYLRALESERFDLLPEGEGARGALRDYAEHLELDPEPYLSEFDARVATLERPVLPDVRRKRRSTKAKALSLPIPMLIAAIALSMVLLSGGGSQLKRAAESASAAPSSTASPRSGSRSPTDTPDFRARRAEVAVAALARAKPPTRRHLGRLVIEAQRGDSWLTVRVSSIHGRVLYTGNLAKGRTLRLAGKRLWVRVGAATNVDLSVNGSRPDVDLYGTFDALVTPAGFKKVPLAQ